MKATKCDRCGAVEESDRPTATVSFDCTWVDKSMASCRRDLCRSCALATYEFVVRKPVSKKVN